MWRLVNTGLRSAPQNVALDRALLEARSADEISTTLRFYRCTRAALLGLQHSAAQELDTDYCREHRIPVQRRISGGRTILTAPEALHWALYLSRAELGNADATALAKRLCHAVATAISALGIQARFRARDEIEVDGRTIGGCGVASDERAVLVSGFIFVRVDIEEWVRALRMPASYSLDHLRAGASERIADLGTLLGRPPDLKQLRHNIVEAFESDCDSEFAEADLTLTEESRYRAALPAVDTVDWVDLVSRPVEDAPRAAATVHSRRGEIRAAMIHDARTGVLRHVWLSGALGFDAKRTKLDLEATLRDVPLTRLQRTVEWFFASHPRGASCVTPLDVTSVISRAVGQPLSASSS